mmetsp:Transcript_15619/g.30120  ORF Transcript_15619/g.30120 Transcript_15619/m.30120 type:complete len:287 (+) Transcript_15619:1867-2727(+)
MESRFDSACLLPLHLLVQPSLPELARGIAQDVDQHAFVKSVQKAYRQSTQSAPYRYPGRQGHIDRAFGRRYIRRVCVSGGRPQGDARHNQAGEVGGEHVVEHHEARRVSHQIYVLGRVGDSLHDNAQLKVRRYAHTLQPDITNRHSCHLRQSNLELPKHFYHRVIVVQVRQLVAYGAICSELSVCCKRDARLCQALVVLCLRGQKHRQSIQWCRRPRICGCRSDGWRRCSVRARWRGSTGYDRHLYNDNAVLIFKRLVDHRGDCQDAEKHASLNSVLELHGRSDCS